MMPESGTLLILVKTSTCCSTIHATRIVVLVQPMAFPSPLNLVLIAPIKSN